MKRVILQVNRGAVEAAGRFAAGAEPLGKQPVWTTVGARLCFDLHRTDFDFAFGLAG